MPLYGCSHSRLPTPESPLDHKRDRNRLGQRRGVRRPPHEGVHVADGGRSPYCTSCCFKLTRHSSNGARACRSLRGVKWVVNLWCRWHGEYTFGLNSAGGREGTSPIAAQSQRRSVICPGDELARRVSRVFALQATSDPGPQRSHGTLKRPLSYRTLAVARRVCASTLVSKSLP